MKKEIESIISLLKRTYEKNAWHGPSVQEVLRSLTVEHAFIRLNNTHSIIELVAHMTSWRNYVIKRLQGEENFEVANEDNFPNETDWLKALRDLDASQMLLLASLENFPEAKLHDTVPRADNQSSYYTLVHGIIHHDLYHTGQIMLIKKAALESK